MDVMPSFEEIIARYHKTLSKIAATFEADAKLQQDLLQEILLSVKQALTNFKGDSAMHTYLISTLASKLREDTMIVRFITIAIVAGTLFVFAPLFYEMRLGLPSMFDYVFYYSLSIVLAICTSYAVWIRRDIWNTHAQNTKDYLQLMLKQNAASAKTATIGKMFCFAWLLLFYGIVLWMILPSLFAGTLLRDLSAVAKLVIGSSILLVATIVGVLGVYGWKKVQSNLSKKGDVIRSLLKDFS